MRLSATAVLLLGLACWAGQASSRQILQRRPAFPNPALTDSFVEIIDGDFVLGCNRFPISGWNQWELMEAGAGAPMLVGSQLPPGKTGPAFVTTVLDDMVASGMTVLRTWAHGTSPTYPSMLKPGEYNEGMLRGLDFLLDEARKRGIKAILSFTSNWTPTGGVDEYTNFTGGTHNDFFSSPGPMELYRQYVKTILTRTNTINGRMYSEDPTVMAWDLINEPVCRSCGPGAISKWVAPMAAYVKSLDRNHLLTVGEEGFYSATQGSIPSNPMYGESSWAAEWSQDFVLDHSNPNVDFAAFHIWPDMWKCSACTSALPLDFFKKWIQQHVKGEAFHNAAVLRKPLLLEEFGKQRQDGQRDAYFQTAYDAVEESLRAGGPLKGALFWQYYAPGQAASKGEGSGAGKDGIYSTDSTFGLAKANAATTQALSSGPAGRCTKKAPPAATCSKPGFEGPDCKVDINECVRGTARCGKNALCMNTPGGFTCDCPAGTAKQSGDCVEDTARLKAAAAGYWSDPSGKGQACDRGADIPFPKTAKGWAEDPIGGFERNPAKAGGIGSRVPVTLAECAIACDVAEGCEMFTYNDVTQDCFLKSKQCPLRNTCWEPPTTCSATSDDGRKIDTPCGAWQTYYKSAVHRDASSYCAKLPAPQAGGAAAAGK